MRLAYFPSISLTIRMTLLLAVATSTLCLALCLILIHRVTHHFAEADAAEIEAVALAIEPAIEEHWPARKPKALHSRLDDILVGHHNTALRLSTAEGQVLFSSPNSRHLLALDSSIAPNTMITLPTVGVAEYRVAHRLLQLNDQRFNALISVSAQKSQGFIKTLKHELWGILVLSVSILILICWWAVRWSLKPLKHIASQVRDAGAETMEAQLDVRLFPREIVPLVMSINATFSRIEEAFSRLDAYDADIAHELRTPLASLLTQTQVALSQQRDTETYREVLAANSEQLEKMAQMVNDLLYLARVSDPTGIDRKPVELESIIGPLVDYYEDWAADANIAIQHSGDAVVIGNFDMLQRAFSNLLSNAVRHGRHDGLIRIEIFRDESNNARVSIENPAKHSIGDGNHDHLFTRFQRGEQSTYYDRKEGIGGAGLGLAIVRSIIEAHDGSVSLRSRNDIVRVDVLLPARPDATSGSDTGI